MKLARVVEQVRAGGREAARLGGGTDPEMPLLDLIVLFLALESGIVRRWDLRRGRKSSPSAATRAG